MSTRFYVNQRVRYGGRGNSVRFQGQIVDNVIMKADICRDARPWWKILPDHDTGRTTATILIEEQFVVEDNEYEPPALAVKMPVYWRSGKKKVTGVIERGPIREQIGIGWYEQWEVRPDEPDGRGSRRPKLIRASLIRPLEVVAK